MRELKSIDQNSSISILEFDEMLKLKGGKKKKKLKIKKKKWDRSCDDIQDYDDDDD